MPTATVNPATRTLERPRRPRPTAAEREIDLDRVVFDPEYRARVRDALNRPGHKPRRDPGKEA